MDNIPELDCFKSARLCPFLLAREDHATRTTIHSQNKNRQPTDERLCTTQASLQTCSRTAPACLLQTNQSRWPHLGSASRPRDLFTDFRAPLSHKLFGSGRRTGALTLDSDSAFVDEGSCTSRADQRLFRAKNRTGGETYRRGKSSKAYRKDRGLRLRRSNPCG